MGNQRKILRVLQFISFLEQSPSKTVAQLGSLLDRTVYRYLDLVKECGFTFSVEKHPVHLELPLKQYLLLKNDFPITHPHFKFNAKKRCTN
jgi:predicted DNA-binding transcriptional regulator YafY